MSEIKEFVSIVPLAGFDSDVDLVLLDDSLCLRHVNPDELENLAKSAPGYRFTLENAIRDAEYVIEKKMATNREFRQWHEGSLNVQDIVLALRLFKDGDIDVPTAFLLDSKHTLLGVSNTSPVFRVAESPYFLKQKEIDNFTELWNKLQSVDKEKPHLTFPLAQFNRAFQRSLIEDAILDYMIALESLVFYGEKKSIEPCGKVVGISLGMLIGKNQEERTEIKKKLVKAYNVRNAWVHGNIEKMRASKDVDIEELTTCVEDYLRRTLRRFVEE